MPLVSPDVWKALLARAPADTACSALYDPLLAPATAPDGCFVLGRIAQSLDGRIATASGESRWISGEADLEHTHRLRALSDAVLVGASTVRADDPQLTTRAVEGPSPVRVILDPARRLDERYRVFGEGPPTLLACAAGILGPERLGQAEVLPIAMGGGGIDLRALLATLAGRGLRRIFVEGGGTTVSRFLVAGFVDRLHVTIAPLLIGGGIPAFTFPRKDMLADGMRFDWSVHRLGDDLLVDIPLGRHRLA
jgi:diaminohydroxyphosphoribosylaminopyrimidine deaminase / 5-amino-6-(5-phosphoribosylamino)uracil reductase